MNIEDFKIFSDLAETGSFSLAAQRNRITQSAVSQRIIALEKSFGFPLVDRTKKVLNFTPEGQLFQKLSQEIYTLYEKTYSEIIGLRNTAKGTLKIGIDYSISINALTPILKKFTSSYKNVNLQLCSGESSELSIKIAQGSLDIIFTVAEEKPAFGESYLPLYEEPLVAICMPKNTLALQKDASFAELNIFPFFAFSKEVTTRKIIDQAFNKANLECQPISFSNSVEVIKNAVEGGAGVAIVPLNSVKKEQAAGTLHVLPLRGTKLFRQIVAITRRGRAPTLAAQKFLELLKKTN